MELLIVTGMSGSGKSNAANVLEDIGYYCVDNIPPLIIPSLINLFSNKHSEFEKLAIITDMRGGELFKDIMGVLEDLKKNNISYKILFLTANDNILVSRFKENRRCHPLCINDSITVSEAVKNERLALSAIRSLADYVIDTSALSVNLLKEKLTGLFTKNLNSITVQCLSFGFKYGAPTDADIIFDVRCLPNPFYIDELKNLTGKDSKVKNFVMNSVDSTLMFQKIYDLIRFSLPLYLKEGKSQLVIAFGCTGGKHRSVTFAELLSQKLKEDSFTAISMHRDINKI